MNLASWFRGASVSETEVRMEIWRLGERHRGAALEGALIELKAKDLAGHQASVLRACVRKLRAR
jgi:hypothetical protein